MIVLYFIGFVLCMLNIYFILTDQRYRRELEFESWGCIIFVAVISLVPVGNILAGVIGLCIGFGSRKI